MEKRKISEELIINAILTNWENYATHVASVIHKHVKPYQVRNDAVKSLIDFPRDRLEQLLEGSIATCQALEIPHLDPYENDDLLKKAISALTGIRNTMHPTPAF